MKTFLAAGAFAAFFLHIISFSFSSLFTIHIFISTKVEEKKSENNKK
jgi:hypothetical protein